jgi:hypothetical protein
MPVVRESVDVLIDHVREPSISIVERLRALRDLDYVLLIATQQFHRMVLLDIESRASCAGADLVEEQSDSGPLA